MSLGIRGRWQHAKTALTGRIPASPMPVIRMSAAMTSRLMRGWHGLTGTMDDVLQFNLTTIRKRCRQLAVENGEAAGILLDFESDIIGPHGAILQFRARRPRGALLENLNDTVEGGFKAWGARGMCTKCGSYDLAQLQRMMLRTVIVDGEFLAIKHRDPNLAHGYALQIVDPDQLDVDCNQRANANGVSVVMGVECDRFGKPLAYHIWEGHPESTNRGERKRYAADDIVHVFKRVRVGQTRGLPWFAPALVTWKLGDQYTEAELVQSMLAAAQGGFFVSQDGYSAGEFPKRYRTDPTTGEKIEIPYEIEATPGMSRALPPGWKFEAWQPTHPTANYVGFMKAVKRIIGRAFGRSYASLTGDLSDVNFSSMRTDRVRETEQNKLHQADILVAQFMRQLFIDWFTMADLKGVFGVLPMSPRELVQAATWMCRGWPWIDPLKDLAATKLELELRLTSPQRVCAERGRDFFEIVDEIAEAQEYAKNKNVSMEAVGLALTLDMSDGDDDTTSSKKEARTNPLRLTA